MGGLLGGGSSDVPAVSADYCGAAWCDGQRPCFVDPYRVRRLGATASDLALVRRPATQSVHSLVVCSIELPSQVAVCGAAWCGGQRPCFVDPFRARCTDRISTRRGVVCCAAWCERASNLAYRNSGPLAVDGKK